MLTPSNAPAPALGGPLTARALMLACHGRREAWVQVRKHTRAGALVLCGRVVELRDSDGEWFKVDTEQGTLWAQGRHLRLCSGDGRCTCEPTPNAEGQAC